jgi:hypothetical protein
VVVPVRSCRPPSNEGLNLTVLYFEAAVKHGLPAAFCCAAPLVNSSALGSVRILRELQCRACGYVVVTP